MRHAVIVVLAAGALSWALDTSAAQGTWTGTISDSMCGLSHSAMTEHGTKATDKQCTEMCVQHGAKYVFVTDGKVVNIANQNFKALKTFAGDRVTLSGNLSGDTVTVTKLAKAK